MQFFKDKKGAWDIAKWPNIPLAGWAVFRLLSLLVENDQIKQGCISISQASLFVWAYLEITYMTSGFRRSLGLLVLASVVAGYFR